MIIGSLMDEAIASSQIEGAVITRVFAKAMLRTGRSARIRSERMTINGYRTTSMLRERALEPLSMDLLLDIQRSITQDTLEDEADAGRLRTSDDIRVVEFESGDIVHSPPPARELRTRLKRMLAFANSTADAVPWLHPLVRASILHFWLAYEHPFVDGNGRTARALLYWLMLREGYELFEFLTISQSIHAARDRYYRAFRHSESDANDLTYFVAFQAHMVLRAVDKLWNRLASLPRRQRRLLTLARTAEELNLRQRVLLEHAIRHPAQLTRPVVLKPCREAGSAFRESQMPGSVRTGFDPLFRIDRRTSTCHFPRALGANPNGWAIALPRGACAGNRANSQDGDVKHAARLPRGATTPGRDVPISLKVIPPRSSQSRFSSPHKILR